jgi:hypothetical protein
MRDCDGKECRNDYRVGAWLISYHDSVKLKNNKFFNNIMRGSSVICVECIYKINTQYQDGYPLLIGTDENFVIVQSIARELN